MSYSFQLGRTFRTIGSLYVTTFSRFALLAVIAFAVAAVVACILAGLLFLDGSIRQMFDTSMSSTILLLVAAMLPLAFLHAAITYGTMEQLRGHEPDLRELIENGLANLFSALRVLILFGLCVGLGLLLLFVPGLFAATVFWVALPAEAEERGGALASMGRSFELTSGYSWPVFAVVFAVIAAFLLAYQFIAILALLIGAGGGTWFGFAATIVILLISWVAFVLPLPIAAAVSYQALRFAKEGGSDEEFAVA